MLKVVTRRMYDRLDGANSVAVLDWRSRSVVRLLRGFNGPQGIAYIPTSGSLFVSNGGNGTVITFDSGSYSRIGTITITADADNMRYDSTSGLLLIGYGAGDIAIANASSMRVVKTISLIRHPEGFQLQEAGSSVFVNVPAGDYVAIVDRTTDSVISRWATPRRHRKLPNLARRGSSSSVRWNKIAARTHRAGCYNRKHDNEIGHTSGFR